VAGVGHLDFEEVVIMEFNHELKRNADLLLWSHFLYRRLVHKFVFVWSFKRFLLFATVYVYFDEQFFESITC